MDKLRKCERVEIYLQNLMKQDDFGLKELEKLKYRDIYGIRELADVGDRTISNVLKAFKIKNGLKVTGNKLSKREIVKNFLNEKLKSGEFTTGQLLKLRYIDLKAFDELKDIGKTTISCTLSEVKKLHDYESFEESLLGFLELEREEEEEQTAAQEGQIEEKPEKISLKEETQEEVTLHTASQEKAVEEESLAVKQEEAVEEESLAVKQEEVVEEESLAVKQEEVVEEESHRFQLESEDIKWIRQMINDFQKERVNKVKQKDLELMELKHALLHVGINPQKIVYHYWEDMAKKTSEKSDAKNEMPLSMKSVSRMKASGLI